ncbi:ATP-binding protein [Phenylobacterium sp.]|uniref:PAS domain-containing sensor histidine kinase n=1 Tax=Phenylobacterium sp. TaxID=1871053 RepID=UPI00374DB244
MAATEDLRPKLFDDATYLRKILDAHEDCIKVLDLDGVLQSVNAGGVVALEFAAESDMLGLYWPDTWTGEGRDAAVAAVETAANGAAARFFGPAATAKGTLKYWDVQVSPMADDAGATVAILVVSRDVTAHHTENQALLEASQAELLSERHAAELREQFIAVLGHDLRNPLASIQAGGRLLVKTPLDDRGRMLVSAMQASVMRMAGLIDDVMDFARARLGGGFEIEAKVDERLSEAIHLAIDELRLANPDREIEAEIDLADPVACDSGRIAQLLSNLLGNALRHGAESAPVRVRAQTGDGRFELSVANAGPPIPPARIVLLFEPFERAEHDHGQQGLGLGLYIASGIAKAHGGELGVISDATETRFTLSMPLG